MIEYYKNLSLENLFYINEEGIVCQEEFRDIPEYEGLYQVSDLGRVKSLYFKRQLILKSRLNEDGYLYINMYHKNKSSSFKNHQLVAIVFLNHRPNGMNGVVDHKNKIKYDNRLSNLQIITNRHNCSKDRKGSSIYRGVYWNKIGKNG